MTTIAERYAALHPTSRKLHERALALFPDGVTHDIRQQAPFPLYVTHAAGSRKWDVDGNEIIDYVMGHGSLLLGHQYPSVVDAVAAQAQKGTHYGASHETEIRWGELVTRLVPSAERLRFTSSGTEATMMALRLARAFTGRDKIVRLREHFHGWNDSVSGQPAPLPRARRSSACASTSTAGTTASAASPRPKRRRRRHRGCRRAFSTGPSSSTRTTTPRSSGRSRIKATRSRP